MCTYYFIDTVVWQTCLVQLSDFKCSECAAFRDKKLLWTTAHFYLEAAQVQAPEAQLRLGTAGWPLGRPVTSWNLQQDGESSLPGPWSWWNLESRIPASEPWPTRAPPGCAAGDGPCSSVTHSSGGIGASCTNPHLVALWEVIKAHKCIKPTAAANRREATL